MSREYCVHEGEPSWHQRRAGHASAGVTCGFTRKRDAEKLARGLRKHHPGLLVFITKRQRGGRGLHGIGTEKPLQMAEFVIGQMPGEKKGAVYQGGNRPACRVGLGLRTVKGVIPFKQAKNSFLQARAHFLGGEKVGGAGATAFAAQGSWRDPATGTVYDEPTFVGQIIWTPSKYEPTPKVFRSQMKKMCEDVACRLAQKEVLLRMQDGTRTTLTRCSPRGKAAPR